MSFPRAADCMQASPEWCVECRLYTGAPPGSPPPLQQSPLPTLIFFWRNFAMCPCASTAMILGHAYQTELRKYSVTGSGSTQKNFFRCCSVTVGPLAATIFVSESRSAARVRPTRLWAILWDRGLGSSTAHQPPPRRNSQLASHLKMRSSINRI